MSVSQTITFIDREAPVLMGVPANMTADCDNIPTPPVVSATDDCDTNPQVDFDESQVQNGCDVTITRTWTATDACGNVSSASQVISVTDNSVPVFANVPQDVTIGCQDALPTDEPTATDNCDNDVTITSNDTATPGACAGSTVTIRTWTCLLYTSPSPRDQRGSRMPSSA